MSERELQCRELANLHNLQPRNLLSLLHIHKRIRNAAGLSVKSALSHTLLRDTRDDPFIATKGSYFRLMQEYAGLGGDADFFKTESETQISRPIGAGCVCLFSILPPSLRDDFADRLFAFFCPLSRHYRGHFVMVCYTHSAANLRIS